MTALLVKIVEAETTAELHKHLYDNLKYYNSSPVLDFYARKQRERIKKSDIKKIHEN